jgi:hypothetical protein
VNTTFHVHGDESTPQTGKPIPLDGFGGTVDKSIVQLVTTGRLVHEIRTDTIKGRHSARHEKSIFVDFIDRRRWMK